MDILFDKTVKIRKVHNCFACGRKFNKGEKMNRQVNTFDGIGSVYTCLTCLNLIKNFPVYFEDAGIFPIGCVDTLLQENEYKGMMPEQLTTEIK